MTAAILAAAAAWAVETSSGSGLVRQLNALAGPEDAILVAAPDGRIIAAVHADRPLVPASILKLLTTLTALKKLGSDYRFRTEFYLDSDNNLTIKGHGDPLLISETIDRMARHLATLVPVVRDLVLDDAFFASPVCIPGRGTSTEPYDAPNGALCVNFNTVALRRNVAGGSAMSPRPPCCHR